MDQTKVAQVRTAWGTFSLAIRERPIRLLSPVVLLGSLLLLHGAVAFLLVLALNAPKGWTVFLPPFLEIVGWSFVLVLLSLRLWGLRLGGVAGRFARSVGRTVKERPAKLLAGILLVAGIPYEFVREIDFDEISRPVSHNPRRNTAFLWEGLIKRRRIFAAPSHCSTLQALFGQTPIPSISLCCSCSRFSSTV